MVTIEPTAKFSHCVATRRTFNNFNDENQAMNGLARVTPSLRDGLDRRAQHIPTCGMAGARGRGEAEVYPPELLPSKGGGCVSFGSTHRDTRPRLISETGSLKHSASPDEHQLVDLCVGNIPLRIRDTETGKVDAARLA